MAHPSHTHIPLAYTHLSCTHTSLIHTHIPHAHTHIHTSYTLSHISHTHTSLIPTHIPHTLTQWSRDYWYGNDVNNVCNYYCHNVWWSYGYWCYHEIWPVYVFEIIYSTSFYTQLHYTFY